MLIYLKDIFLHNKDRWILEAKMSIEAYACKLRKKNGEDIAKNIVLNMWLRF